MRACAGFDCGGDQISVFFFQAEDGIRDGHVTGVQTCALPISSGWIAHIIRGRPTGLAMTSAGVKFIKSAAKDLGLVGAQTHEVLHLVQEDEAVVCLSTSDVALRRDSRSAKAAATSSGSIGASRPKEPCLALTIPVTITSPTKTPRGARLWARRLTALC